ncbi:MAG TPA: SDR family oxidoreductase [Lacunisphaera sp.]|jgi:dTDP-4-dehydrorhamnose reductase
MRILLAGASGLVGAEVARQAADAGHVVVGLVGRWTGAIPGVAEAHAVDLSDGVAANEWVRRVRPEVVINAAAISEPAACEANPMLSQVLNVTFPANLAAAAEAVSARFIHISSEQVFDGANPPYRIGDPPSPINLYGRQKVESEQLVLSASKNAAVVRAPLLLGNSLSGKRSVHEKLFEIWSGGNAARFYVDEFRQACTAGNLAAALLEVVARPELRGVFHWAGAELSSRYELGQRLAARFGVPPALVTPVHRAETPAISAKRPANLALDLAPLNRELRFKPQTLDKALHELVVPVHFREWQRKITSSSQT